MDSLNYRYNKGTNQLNYVTDGVPYGNYPNDIDNQTVNNYKYNAIGELAKDDSGKIDTIIWNVYGKIKKIVKYSPIDSTPSDSIVFAYDPLGNRLEKRTYKHQRALCHICPSVPISDTTLYQRDAQGNISAIYQRQNKQVLLNEWDIYGSKRVGTLDTSLLIYPIVATVPEAPLDSVTISYLEGQKRYELTNHLGNVLVTVSDRKWAIDTPTAPTIAYYYQPNIINAQDYYPFGMPMPGRSFQLLNDSCYRFGFNGKLHDDDIYGSKNSYDYGMRMLDPRLGRFMSVDPLSKKFPELSSYQYASNRPIEGIDLDGLEFTPSTHVDYPKVHDFSTTCYWIDAFLYNSTVGALYNTSSAAINIVASQATATPYTQMVDASNSYKALTTPITWNDVGKAFTDPKNYEGVLTTFVGAWEFKASFYESSYVAAGEESMVAARVSTAETFYSDAGFDAETATKHMEGIDFSKDVSTSTLPKGTIINQWVDNTTGKVGNYFTTGDNTAANIGKDVSNSTLKQYTLTKDVNVLQSTAAEYKGNAGGGTQYFSPELPANVTEVKK